MIELGAFKTRALVKDNVGFRTNESGSNQILTGNTFVEITHSMSVEPRIRDITIKPGSSLSAQKAFWVDTITPTTFRINIDSTEVSNLTYYWVITTPYDGDD